MKIGSAVPPPKAEGVKNKRPQLAIDQVFKTLRSGLKIYVERSGDGPKVVKGSQVKVHYDGWLAEDYSKFDSSRDKRRPFEFELGAGKVIKGWEEGLTQANSIFNVDIEERRADANKWSLDLDKRLYIVDEKIEGNITRGLNSSSMKPLESPESNLEFLIFNSIGVFEFSLT